MRHELRMLIFWLIAVSVSVSCEIQGTPTTIEWSRTRVDLGRAIRGQTLEAEFVATNRGLYDVELLIPQASCGCTAAVVGSSRLRPGESTTLRVSVDTTYQGDGPQEKSVSVPTAAGSKSEMFIRFDLQSEFRYKPNVLVLSRSSSRPEWYEGSVVVEPIGAERVVTVTSSNPAIRVSLVEEAVAGRSWRITATRPAGGWDTGVLFIKTSSSNLDTISIPLALSPF